MLAGIFAMASAVALIGQVTAPWQLYAVNALLALGWAGTSLGMITNTLGLWFDKKRGMAISLALNGASFGGIVGVPLMVAAIGRFEFSGAMIAAAVVTVVLLVPVILILVGRPPDRMSVAVASAAADAPSWKTVSRPAKPKPTGARRHTRARAAAPGAAEDADSEKAAAPSDSQKADPFAD